MISPEELKAALEGAPSQAPWATYLVDPPDRLAAAVEELADALHSEDQVAYIRALGRLSYEGLGLYDMEAFGQSFRDGLLQLADCGVDGIELLEMVVAQLRERDCDVPALEAAAYLVDLCKDQVGPYHETTMMARNTRALLFSACGDARSAAEEFGDVARMLVERNDDRASSVLASWARALSDAGKQADAIAAYEEAIEKAMDASAGVPGPELSFIQLELISLRCGDDPHRFMDEVHSMLTSCKASDLLELPGANHAAELFLDLAWEKKDPRGLQIQERIVEGAVTSAGPRSMSHAIEVCNLAMVLRHLGRGEEAEEKLRWAISVFESHGASEEASHAQSLMQGST